MVFFANIRHNRAREAVVCERRESIKIRLDLCFCIMHQRKKGRRLRPPPFFFCYALNVRRGKLKSTPNPFNSYLALLCFERDLGLIIKSIRTSFNRSLALLCFERLIVMASGTAKKVSKQRQKIRKQCHCTKNGIFCEHKA